MLFWIGLEMIEFCYQDTIGDYLVPNGTPPLILKKMKEMDNPSEVFDNGGYQDDLKLEIGISTFRHIMALLDHAKVEYRECSVSERLTEDYLLPIALFGSANGAIGIPNGQMVCEFTKTFSSKTLNHIKSKKCKVLLDHVNEGLPYNKEWCKRLHAVLDNSDLPRDSFYFFTGNNKFKENYEKDFEGELVNVIESTFFETYTKDYCNSNLLNNEVFSSHRRNKHFLSLNRSPRLHRSKMFEYLKEKDLLKYGYVSYIDEGYYVDGELTTNAKDNQAGAFIEREYFENSYLNIVTETWFYEKSLFLTEKIFKPIIYHQPFLLLSGYNSLKLFKDLGYKTFDKIISESYDNEKDDDKRFDMVMSEVNRLSKMSIDKVHDMYLSVKDILEYNYNHFLSEHDVMGTKFFKQ
jgi:hypothetical protein